MYNYMYMHMCSTPPPPPPPLPPVLQDNKGPDTHVYSSRVVTGITEPIVPATTRDRQIRCSPRPRTHTDKRASQTER